MILVYAGNKKAQSDALCTALKDFAISWLCDQDLQKTMAELVERSEKEPVAKAGQLDESAEPFLYFVEEDPQKIYDLQKQLHTAGLTIDAMAVKTENNEKWLLKDLMKEVSTEAKYFRKRDHLHDLIQQADPEQMKASPEYGKAVMLAWQLLHNEELPEDLLDMAIQVLETAPQAR